MSLLRTDLDFVRHMLDEVKYVLAALADVSKEQFLADATLTRAVTRSVEIMGEAAKNTSTEFRVRYPSVP